MVAPSPMRIRALLRRPQRFICQNASPSSRPSRNPHQRRHKSNSSSKQVHPMGAFYESLLEQPLQTATSATHQPTKPSPPESLPKTDKEEVLAKARVVFGSRLAGPAERREEKDKKSVVVAGVKVPPRPSEPDNCCMSGCVNCVWDAYRDDLEEWAMARRQADANLMKEKGLKKPRTTRKQQPATGTGLMIGEGEKGAQHTMISMDDDGGGSESNWGTGLETDLNTEELFKGVPVGIREFMKTEKRLKEKHMREGTVGG